MGYQMVGIHQVHNGLPTGSVRLFQKIELIASGPHSSGSETRSQQFLMAQQQVRVTWREQCPRSGQILGLGHRIEGECTGSAGILFHIFPPT